MLLSMVMGVSLEMFWLPWRSCRTRRQRALQWRVTTLQSAIGAIADFDPDLIQMSALRALCCGLCIELRQEQPTRGRARNTF